MKKIRLRVDSLLVHSFVTEHQPEARGTVWGAFTGNTCNTCGDLSVLESHEWETCTCPYLATVGETCHGQLGC